MSKLQLIDARKMEKLLLSLGLVKFVKKAVMPFSVIKMEEQLLDYFVPSNP